MNLKHVWRLSVLTILSLVVWACSSDDSKGSSGPAELLVTASLESFGNVNVLSFSETQSILLHSEGLSSNVTIEASDNFQVSKDNTSFTTSISIDKSDANGQDLTLYVRFAPKVNSVGSQVGSISFKSTGATTRTLSVSGVGISITPLLTVNPTSIDFGDVIINELSEVKSFELTGINLVTGISLTASENYMVSLDGTTFSQIQNISSEVANEATTIYVRFSSADLGLVSGTLMVQNEEAEQKTVTLKAVGANVVYNYGTFFKQRLAFGGGFDQSAVQTFTLHDDMSNIEAIKMYVKITCPSGGCDDWDVYANVKVKDDASGEFYELGRYITPYWNDNSQLPRGFEFDVTDFKSLLQGSAELRIRTECWNAKGYEISVDFDYIEGTPDYPYYAVSRVIAYDDWSSSGVPYGVSHDFDLTKTVTIPSNAQSTHLRSIISGWGHATPLEDGRGCAEWCFRTHGVKINNSTMFQHNLGPLGCASNPVSNQNPGNWKGERAGWCPGMEVPTRIDNFNTSMASSTFSFEYDYEDWVTDGAGGDAFYATSTFVVVKSDTPIVKPTVAE